MRRGKEQHLGAPFLSGMLDWKRKFKPGSIFPPTVTSKAFFRRKTEKRILVASPPNPLRKHTYDYVCVGVGVPLGRDTG